MTSVVVTGGSGKAGRAGDEPVDVLPFYAVASVAETPSAAAVGTRRRLRWLATRRLLSHTWRDALPEVSQIGLQ